MNNIYITFSFFIIILICGHAAIAQDRYFTRQGHISFFSHTPVEDIRAVNNQVLSIIDIATGDVEITLLMKSFSFEKALMQEHFNENYVESHKYPKANFSGKIENLEQIIAGENGSAEIKGSLTIKGVTKALEVESRITIENDTISLKGKFMVTVADFNIKIPAVVRNNIAKEVEVTYNLVHQPYP